uniref:C2H2-type domain-containing protein n=1 Tax=Panagrolaimus davidi TaxID=227884 RepID=A0A914PV90_9BILA
MRLKLMVLFFLLIYISAAPLRKRIAVKLPELSDPDLLLEYKQNDDNGLGYFYGFPSQDGSGSGGDDGNDVVYQDSVGDGSGSGFGNFDYTNADIVSDGSGTGFDDAFGAQMNLRSSLFFINLPLFPSIEFDFNTGASKIAKNNNAKALFNECSGGPNNCGNNKHKLPENERYPDNEPPENFSKRVKTDAGKVGADGGEETSIVAPGIPETSEVDECYFAHVRKTSEETQSRSKQSEVSSECSGNLISFQTLIDTEIDEFGTTNAAQIILERGAGEFDLDFENVEVKNEIGKRKICNKHHDELYGKWKLQKYGHILRATRGAEHKEVCSMDHRYQPHQTRPLKQKSFSKVTSRQAASFVKKTGILLHVGLPVCHAHGKSLDKVLAEDIVESDGYNIEPSYDDFGFSPNINRPVEEGSCTPTNDESVPRKCFRGTYAQSQSSSSQESSKDPTFQAPDRLPLVIPPQIDVTEEVKKTFYAFADATGAQRYRLSKDFESLQRRTKQKKVCQYRSFMDVIAKIMAGEKSKILMSMANQKIKGYDWQKSPDKQMEKALGYVKLQYYAATNRDTRLNVIAQVAHIYPLAAIQKAVPGITSRFYQAARKLAKQRLECSDPPKKKRVTKRYNEYDAEYFIDFISSPPVSTMLPSAHIKVKAPDGTKTTIPAVMRRFHDTEVINMFERHCKEDGYDSCVLSEYAMRSILKAFLKLKQVISVLLDKGLIDQQWHDNLEFGLQESENYFKTDFYTQIKMTSRIGDLCIPFALSDPNDKEFRAVDCPKQDMLAHEHDLQFDRMRLFDQTIVDIRDTLTQLIEEATDPKEKEDISELRDDVFRSEKDIMEWKKHIVRSKYSNHVRGEIIDELQEGEAFITIDYATRYLPIKHIEKQSDFFGKKGMSWHISHVLAKIDDKLVQHTFTHLMGEEDQNGQAVIAIITDVFKKLQKLNIKKVTIRSDNAGYYKNAQVLISLPVIAEENGIVLKRYSFSESQSGKAEADREAGRMKRRMKYALAHGSNIQSGFEMLEAITSGTKPLSGLTVVLATLNYVEVPEKATIPLISNLFDFVYGDGKIKFWRHYNIGSGKKLSQKKFKDCVIRPTLTTVKEWDHSPDDTTYKFWMATKEETEAKIPEANMAITPPTEADPEEPSGYEPTMLWSCPVGNCEKQFVNEGNLHNHLILGDHQFAVEKFTLQEFSFKLYQNKLEGFDETRKSTLNQRRLETEGSSTEAQPEMGWALRTTKKGTRYTTDMRAFLDEEFSKYKSKQKKPDAKEVESNMASARTVDGKRMFTADERLSSRQIAAYFKRKAENLQQQNAGNLVLTNEEQERVSDTIIQEMNDETGELEIEYEDSQMFVTDAEEVLGCVRNTFNDPANAEKDDDPEYNGLYADEDELETLYQHKKRCPRKKKH